MIGNEVQGANYAVRVTDALGIEVCAVGGGVIWSSSTDSPPTLTLEDKRSLALASAKTRKAVQFEEGEWHGQRISLAGFEATAARLELVLAFDEADALMVKIQEPGGDLVRSVEHLYMLEKTVSEGGYMVIPHGSGYLIPADCPYELPGPRAEIADFNSYNPHIGGGWSLPLFGMVRGEEGMCVMVEDWWDCWVEAHHRPGELSAIDFNWTPSLGTLSYARRMFFHFAKDMDYAGMAKRYRQHAKEQGLVRTLAEKAEESPAIDRYIENILVRWPAWDPRQLDRVRSDLKRFQELGFGVNLFFPKIHGSGWDEDKSATTTHALWQGFLHPDPVPGGWPEVSRFSKEASDLGMLVQGFVAPLFQHEDAPGYDLNNYPILEDGTRRLIRGDWTRMSMVGDVERNRRVLDSIRNNGVHFDVLYFDGYAAFSGPVEDFSPDRRCDRRQGFESMNACCRETRAAGIIPGGELARFWCMADCDYFFYTDWAPDRLVNVEVAGAPGPIGEPVPLFELVFHECYMAGFAGGGHTVYGPGVDWWRDATPRLYELLFAAAPSFSWLPNGRVPVEDWDSDEAKARFAWLKRRQAYFAAVAKSEMTEHQFLSADRKQQRVAFANGVSVEVNMGENLCKVTGVETFTGDWEVPSEDLGWYPSLKSEFPGK